MLTYLEAGPGLAIVMWIQSRRNPWSDRIARALHVLGHPAVSATLISSYARQQGNLPLVTRVRRVTVWQLVIIYGLKLILRRPRPHLARPEQVTGLVWQPGYGIPSGHVMGALVYGLIIAYRPNIRATRTDNSNRCLHCFGCLGPDVPGRALSSRCGHWRSVGVAHHFTL